MTIPIPNIMTQGLASNIWRHPQKYFNRYLKQRSIPQDAISNSNLVDENLAPALSSPCHSFQKSSLLIIIQANLDQWEGLITSIDQSEGGGDTDGNITESDPQTLQGANGASRWATSH